MFDHITTLEQSFLSNSLTEVPKTMNVNGLDYDYADTNDATFNDIVSGAKNAYAMYRLNRTPANVTKFKELHNSTDDRQSVQDAVMLAWVKARSSLSVVPAAARFISRNRIMNAVNKGIFESENGASIGLKPEAIVIGFNGNSPIEAKTDTGADMCSMHAENISVNGSQVSFSMSGKSYQVPLIRTLNVKQADSGGESRPVIKCSISINGNTVKDVECNLNDRTDMVPLLLGKNFLQQGKFNIVVEDETIDWDAVHSLMEDVTAPVDDAQSPMDVVRAAFEILYNDEDTKSE